MSTLDKMERILKEIHLQISNGKEVPGNPEQAIIDRKQMLSVLEKLNLAVYEIMDQYEVTSQARELAQRRVEKDGERQLRRISEQADDIYAASLLYTDEALKRVEGMMEKAITDSKDIWRKINMELELEKGRVQRNHEELREQLQDFRDSNKYLRMIEESNRERDREMDGGAPEKRIQNEAKHYPMSGKPEIRVNPAYFQRRKQLEDDTASDVVAADMDAADAGANAADVDAADAGANAADVDAADAGANAADVDAADAGANAADVDAANAGADAADMDAADATTVADRAAAEAGDAAMTDVAEAEDAAMTDVADAVEAAVPMPLPEAKLPEERTAPTKPEVRVNLNAAYFKWKAQEGKK